MGVALIRGVGLGVGEVAGDGLGVAGDGRMTTFTWGFLSRHWRQALENRSESGDARDTGSRFAQPQESM